MDRLQTCRWKSPLGEIHIIADRDNLHRLTIAPSNSEGCDDDTPDCTSLLAEAVSQLSQWFVGQRRTFDLPLAPASTPRGEDLRMAIANIHYGEVASYGQLARIANSGPRAIGQACRRNPFPIIIPCHRVIAAHSQIGHYSGGNGVATKAWLLDFETIQQQRNMP